MFSKQNFEAQSNILFWCEYFTCGSNIKLPKKPMISYDTSSSSFFYQPDPNSKVHGANTGPIWGRQDPGGPHFGTMNLVIRGDLFQSTALYMNKHCFQ